MSIVHTQFQCSLFITNQWIQKRLTNSSCVYYSQNFNDMLLLRPLLDIVWGLQGHRWSKTSPILPVQADSQQGIHTQLAGKAGHEYTYNLHYKELKTA